jgi:TRAP-type C4-dicarboxylate transport system permease small subunit
MVKFERWVHSTTRGVSFISGLAVMLMMLLTCADVILRLFGHPIPGTYELVGFLGAVTISFAMAYTSVEKSHIAVEIFVERLPRRLQYFLESVISLISFILFAVIARQCFVYTLDMKQSGEVSLTLGMPIYPIIAGVAVGCVFLSLVLLFDVLKSARRIFK